MDAALVVTSTTTSGTRSCLLISSLMRENSDTAEFKFPAATAQSGILLHLILYGEEALKS